MFCADDWRLCRGICGAQTQYQAGLHPHGNGDDRHLHAVVLTRTTVGAGVWHPIEWLPIAGWGDLPGDKILPSITLGSAYAAYIARLSRAGMLEILSQDYIRTARAKGLPEWRVVTQHALRGGLIPVIAFLGPAFAGLLAGSFVVETIFQIPGLGRFYVQAAFNRDYTMILGTTVFLSTLIVLFNLVSDVIAAWLNPRLRAQFSRGNS